MSGQRVVTSLLSASLLFGGPLACDDGGGPLPIGATCSVSAQCESGICGGNMCLDPAGDEDQDGLLNGVEAGLSTNPVAADTDGDGVDDPTEVGDPLAPPDRDGDGKIDAIESDVADVDGDCLVDEVDPRDGVSDPPSAELPDACGGAAANACGDSPLAGTCAEPLGEMIYECFRPMGICRYYATVAEGERTRFEWDNGALLTWSVSPTFIFGELTGPDGAVCGVVNQEISDAEPPPPATFIVDVEGPSFQVAQGDDGVVLITCPSGEQLPLDQAEADTFAACAGLTVSQTCELAIDDAPR